MHSLRSIPGILCATLCVCLLSLFSTGTLSAQTLRPGIIEGRVLNLVSGSFLDNVRLTVQGTVLEARTTDRGEYRFSAVPPGVATVSVTYTGLVPETKTVQVLSGQITRLDFDLVLEGSSAMRPEVVKLDAFTVAEKQITAEAMATQEKRSAPNAKDVVSIDEFGDLGVTNPGFFLSYMPGVATVNSTGEVSNVAVRGMPTDGTLVTIDGVRLAGTDSATRAFDLTTIAATNLERIELTKEPTPDMPASAVGGSINLVTKSGFNRATPLLRYDIFITDQAKVIDGRFTPHDRWGTAAGPDPRSSLRPIQPGFNVDYILPLSRSLAFTFNLGTNTRLQDREYLQATWDRVKLVETAGNLNSVLNIFSKDYASLGVDWKVGRGVFHALIDFTAYEANTRQNFLTWNFGAGAVGGYDFTKGASTAVGSLSTSLGQSIIQNKSLLHSLLAYTYDGNVWKINGNISFSEARRKYNDINDGIFGGGTATYSNLIVSATGLDDVTKARLPRFAVTTAAGVPVNPFDPTPFTLATATSGRLYFKNSHAELNLNATRSFDTWLPLSLKAGLSASSTRRDNWTQSLSWNIRPPAGATQVGNYDLIADGYSARRDFKDGNKIKFLSLSKLYDLYLQHPSYFVLNETTAYTNYVRSSKLLDELISAGYLRADLKAFDNRLWIVGGVRTERTTDEGWGPLADTSALYVKDQNGKLVLGSNGRPTLITTDPLAQARLTNTERAAHNKNTYQGWFPSLNARYSLTENFVARAGYSRTIGRPDVDLITPGTTITDPSAANPRITVSNTRLNPWQADNYDLTFECYEFKGAIASVGVFHKEISNFFTDVNITATPALLEQYGLPADLLVSDYQIISQANSTQDASLDGFEWSWRQSFRSFAALPSLIRNFQVSINGTNLRPGGPGADNFTGYSPRIINWGVSYLRPTFSVRINVTDTRGTINAVSAASATVPAGTYTGLSPKVLVALALDYRFYKRLTFHLSVQNLTNAFHRNLTHAPGAPAYTLPTSVRDNGMDCVIGVKGEF